MDSYSTCSFKKICPDAPARAVVIQKRETRCGGAANVALNLAALSPGTDVDLIAVMGSDMGRTVRRSSNGQISVGYSVPTEGLEKNRVIENGEVILRVDSPNIDEMTADTVYRWLKEYLEDTKPDLIVLSDYAGGTINKASFGLLMSHRDRLLIDSKMDITDLGSEEHRTFLVKLNNDEWARATTSDPLFELRFRYAVVTRGGQGADLFVRTRERGGSVAHRLHVPSHDVQEIDVCGCGDTFLAGLAASLLKNDDPYTALQFANAAAAAVVTQEKTAVADLRTVLRMLGKEP